MKTYVYYVMFLNLNERTMLGTAGQNKVNDSYHCTASACPFVTPPSQDTPCSFSIWAELMMTTLHQAVLLSHRSLSDAESQEPPNSG